MKIKTASITIFSLVCAGVLNASLLNFQSGAGVTALQSGGVSTLSSAGAGSFTFALGTFDESVLSGSSDTWGSGFVDRMNGTNNWLLSPPPVANSFQGDRLMSDNSADLLQAYIFGYSIADSSQIILFRNSDWTFPAFNALDLAPDILSLQDAGTEVVLPDGSFTSFGNSFTMVAAVPEPSSFALIAGCFGLALAVVRRRSRCA